METNKQAQHIHGDRTTSNTNGEIATVGQKNRLANANVQNLPTQGENEEVIEG